ncbi:MAG: ATP-binding cassette domain-containing protein [Xanthomonadaceae bacterium]|nr:ATP-binding cassette domain-containing protein [Xanthomonadaceae bacterium]
MSQPSVPAVRLSSVRLVRGGRVILHDLDLLIPQGSMTAVLGPSGSGKSTLLAAITGELAPVAGQVEVFGTVVPRSARGLLAMRKTLGVLLQGNGLLTDLTVAENVALPLRAHARLPEAQLQQRVQAKLDAVGLGAAADLYPRELSGGMARRAALARAIALDPPLLLCDEPLTGLDPIASGVIMRLLRQLNQTLGLTCVVISHHVRETLPVCDQAVVIANGTIMFEGSPAALSASTDPLLRQFLNGDPDGPIAFDAAPRKDAA